MKVAITGHTNGIGKAIYDLLAVDGYSEVIGFSLTTGFDIKNPESRQRIIDAVKDTDDVFINNAYDISGQTELLIDLYSHWKYKENKQIINIGSIATDTPAMVESMIPYLARKASLHHAILQLQKQEHKCRVVNIRFGFVDTRLVNKILDREKHAYLTPKEAAYVVVYTMNSPFYIREIVVTEHKGDA